MRQAFGGVFYAMCISPFFLVYVCVVEKRILSLINSRIVSTQPIVYHLSRIAPALALRDNTQHRTGITPKDTSSTQVTRGHSVVTSPTR